MSQKLKIRVKGFFYKKKFKDDNFYEVRQKIFLTKKDFWLSIRELEIEDYELLTKDLMFGDLFNSFKIYEYQNTLKPQEPPFYVPKNVHEEIIKIVSNKVVG